MVNLQNLDLMEYVSIMQRELNVRPLNKPTSYKEWLMQLEAFKQHPKPFFGV